MKHLLAIILYIIGVALMSIEAELAFVGIIVFLIGMFIHWKYWILGIGAFFVGAGWNKPSL